MVALCARIKRQAAFWQRIGSGIFHLLFCGSTILLRPGSAAKGLPSSAFSFGE
jgi:hypothetical protein